MARPVAVQALPHFRLWLRYDDGIEGEIDLSDLAGRGVAPPHFHAEYAEHEARFAINSLAVLSGRLPPRAMGLVAEWASLHQQELQALWDRASKLEPLDRLDPLP